MFWEILFIFLIAKIVFDLLELADPCQTLDCWRQ